MQLNGITFARSIFNNLYKLLVYKLIFFVKIFCCIIKIDFIIYNNIYEKEVS